MASCAVFPARLTDTFRQSSLHGHISSPPSCEDYIHAIRGCWARQLCSTAILEHNARPLIPCGPARCSARRSRDRRGVFPVPPQPQTPARHLDAQLRWTRLELPPCITRRQHLIHVSLFPTWDSVSQHRSSKIPHVLEKFFAFNRLLPFNHHSKSRACLWKNLPHVRGHRPLD